MTRPHSAVHLSHAPIGAASVARCARGLTITLALTAVNACENSPVEPYDGVKSVSISGPATAAPGTTLRFVATAHYADGSTRDITADATWRSSGPQVSFSSPGVATAQGIGEIDVTATRDVFKAQQHVFVLEPGTFKLGGTLSQKGGGTLFGGRVDVLSGVGQGKFAYGGEYRIYGVAGPIRVEVSSPGYFSVVQDIDVTGNVVRDFELVHLEPPIDVAGDWTLTLGPPPPGCAGGLPAVAQTRSYALSVIQKGTQLDLRLRSPTLLVFDDRLTQGLISGQRVSLSMENLVDDFGVETSTNLLDRLSATETFSFAGWMNFQGNASPIMTTMDGKFRYWSVPSSQPPSWECRATNYPVTLLR
jgi:hypothetical protein